MVYVSYKSFMNLTSCTASFGATMISQSGSLASISPLSTATLPGMISFLLLILPAISCSSKNLATVDALSLPAAQAVRTDIPPASEIRRLTGFPERSNSPDTTKYVKAKSTVVAQMSSGPAPLIG